MAMAGKIFINYRRDDSIGMAGRLHDRLAQTFGRDKLFMDVDHIPAGVDFVAHLNSQLAGCDVVLVVIGPNWLGVKDESGGRRLDNPDDFVAIEIAAALARDIQVIPVLVDGARMPKASELPDSLKPLARRQAVEIRHAHFGHDAEALVARMREALGDEVAGIGRLLFKPRSWRRTATAVSAVAGLLLVGWLGFSWISPPPPISIGPLVDQREATPPPQVGAGGGTGQAQAEAEAKRKIEETEQQRLAALRADEERRAKAAAEEKRKADEAEQQQLAAVKTQSSAQRLATQQIEASFTQDDMARVNAIAMKNKLGLPPFEIKPPDPKLPSTLLKFVGIWASTVGFNEVGRHAMLIVTNVEAQDRAMGYFIWGPPTASTPHKFQFPAGYHYFEGIIADNQLTFNAEKYSMTVRFSTHGSLVMTRKTLSGETFVVTVIPVWRFAQ